MRKILTILSILVMIVLVGLLLSYQEKHPSTFIDEKGQISYDYDAHGKVENFKHLISSGVMISMGIMGLAMPTHWMVFGQRWKYEGEIEPSELSIFMSRALGGILLFIGSLYLLIQIISK